MRFPMALFALALLGLLAALIVHTGFVALRWLRAVFPGASRLVFWIAFGVFAGGTVVCFLFGSFADGMLPRVLVAASHYTLGVLIFAMLIFNLGSLLLFVGRLVKLIPSPQPVIVSLVALTSCTALMFVLGSVGIYQATNVRTVEYTVEADRSPSEPIKIALASDLHLGFIIGDEHLQKVVDAINAAEPDVVCIAGDIFDGDVGAIEDVEAVKEVFRSINAPVYACLGNHDAGSSYNEMLEILADAGVNVLLDETVIFDDRLVITGRRDRSPIGAHEGERGVADALGIPRDGELPVVVLDHQPPAAGEYDASVDLVLSGHTHKGQFFPFSLVTAAIYDEQYGFYRADENSPQVIISCGAGLWGPVTRLGAQSEIVSITLE